MNVETIYRIGQIVTPVLRPTLRMMVSEIRIGENESILYLCYYFSGDDEIRSTTFSDYEIEISE